MPDTTYPDVLDAVRRYLCHSLDSTCYEQVADQVTWEKFYLRYHEILTRFARRLRFQSVEIDDLLQEVWCEVIRQLPQFEYERSRGGFRRWLFVIVRRRAIDHVRQQISRKGVDSGAVGYLDSSVQDPRADDPSVLLDRQFKTEVLHAAMKALRAEAADDEWETFTLCRLNGLNSTEAAARLGVTSAAVRKRLERANQKLRAAISDLVGAEEL